MLKTSIRISDYQNEIIREPDYQKKHKIYLFLIF